MNFGGHSLAAIMFHDQARFAWFVVAAYFVGAAAAYKASNSARKRDRKFWIATASLLVLLGLNKQLDLQTLLTTEGRLLAHSEGWYDERRVVQGLFLLGLAIGGFVAIAAMIRWLRRSPVQVKAAAIGIGILITFVLMRAASFHHMDRWVTINIDGLRSGWWLELAGIAVIGLSALTYRSRPKQSR